MILRLKDVRLAFSQNLFTPGAMNPEDKPKYNATLLIPKGDSQIDKVEKAIEAVAAEKWANKAPAILKALRASNKVCLRDGEEKAQYDGFEGSMYVSASNKVAPLVVDKDKSPLSEASGRPYAGCYVNASLDIWAQDNSYGKRVNATLRGVQFFRDGDAFAGGAPASEDEFDDLSDTGGDADDLI